MKLFLSWSGATSKEIAIIFRDWLPLINQTIDPYMSVEDIEKGAHWSSAIRRELQDSKFGILILTPENTGSTWLHFEAGAIAKSVEEGRLAPILFGLRQADIAQPLSLFQTTLFERDEIFRLVKSINAAAMSEARDERQLDTVFESFWPSLEDQIRPKLAALSASPGRREREKQENERILQELLVLARQQMTILRSPEELFGKETLALLLRLVREPEGAALRLVREEKKLVLAVCARWSQCERDLMNWLAPLDEAERRPFVRAISWFSGYIKELSAVMNGTTTPEAIIKSFAGGEQRT